MKILKINSNLLWRCKIVHSSSGFNREIAKFLDKHLFHTK
jgi:hypothetical protein